MAEFDATNGSLSARHDWRQLALQKSQKHLTDKCKLCFDKSLQHHTNNSSAVQCWGKAASGDVPLRLFLCETSSFVKLHNMQMHCLLFMWQYQGMKASGTEGCGKLPRKMEGTTRTNSVKELLKHLVNDHLTLLLSICNSELDFRWMQGNQSTLFWGKWAFSQSVFKLVSDFRYMKCSVYEEICEVKEKRMHNQKSLQAFQ